MNDEQIISLAIERAQRARYRGLLTDPKKRTRLLDRLNHDPPLDSRYVEWFSSFDKALRTIRVAATAEVYLLSAAAELDGQTMSFQEAVEKIPFCGWGTLIGISPQLAVYYGEAGERAAVIRKEG